jgi:hypothetical protein
MENWWCCQVLPGCRGVLPPGCCMYGGGAGRSKIILYKFFYQAVFDLFLGDVPNRGRGRGVHGIVL